MDNMNCKKLLLQNFLQIETIFTVKQTDTENQNTTRSIFKKNIVIQPLQRVFIAVCDGGAGQWNSVPEFSVPVDRSFGIPPTAPR